MLSSYFFWTTILIFSFDLPLVSFLLFAPFSQSVSFFSLHWYVITLIDKHLHQFIHLCLLICSLIFTNCVTIWIVSHLCFKTELLLSNIRYSELKLIFVLFSPFAFLLTAFIYVFQDVILVTGSSLSITNVLFIFSCSRFLDIQTYHIKVLFKIPWDKNIPTILFS